MQTPEDKDWDRFWARGESKKFSRLSWSKRRILDVLDPYLRSGQKALDAGCGSGFFADVFCRKGMLTTALDYSDASLEMAEKVTRGQAKLVKADMLSDDLVKATGGGFDLIFSDGLFEHFSPARQDKILSNLTAVLNQGGIIVTFVPNRFSPWEIIRPMFMPGIEETPFVMPGLLDLSRRNNLPVIQKGGVNVLPYRLSPEIFGPTFGMLLYTIAKKIS